MRLCSALCWTHALMTDPSPMLPAMQRLNWDASLFEHLSEFQQLAATNPPVPPTMTAVLSAALPAFQAGFSYTASFWQGELTVTLHYQGAELGSSAPAPITCYTETCARLLAGLLGIPLQEGDVASEPEPLIPADKPEAPAAAEPEDDGEPEPEDVEELEDESTAPAPSDDIRRHLSEGEVESAIAMVKAMDVGNRKAFTKAFREVFAVPADAKQIVPFITELQHLQFIDRYTVEAAGGVAS